MREIKTNSKKILNNETSIPIIGFGVWRILEEEEVISVVTEALNAGYRLIDTAMIYLNEEGVGKAIKKSGIQREEIFVTTKLWNTNQGYNNALEAIDVSLAKLGLSYVDLYLIHWPTAGDQSKGENINKREETWRAMEEIYKLGKAKAVGVSNYTIAHLKEMTNYAKITPAINQVEFHPFLYQKELLNYCKENNITLEAHSPFAEGMGRENSIIANIAKKYNKSNSQVMLRWSIQHGAIPLPKSIHKERIKENINIFDFELTEEEMETIDGLNKNLRVRSDPSMLN